MTQTIGLTATLNTSPFEAGVRRYTRGLRDMENASRRANTNLGNANTALGNFGGGGVSSRLGGVATAIGGIGSAATKVAMGGIATLTAAIAGIGVASTSMATSFEQGIADIAALSGKGINDVAPLKDYIMKLSVDPNLKVSATQAASAAQMLAKNGIDMGQQLDGALLSTIALSNATGEDFSLAADVGTDAMAIFGIEAKNMMGVADGITGTLTNSKHNLDSYKYVLSNAGTGARDFGLSLDQLNAITVGTSSTFASGMRQGTALNEMFNRLSAPTDKARKKMDQLGLSVTNSDGTFKDLFTVVDEFNGVLNGTVTTTSTVGGRTDKQNERLKYLQRQYDNTTRKLQDYDAGIRGVGQSKKKMIGNVTNLKDQQKALATEISKLESIEGKQVTSTRKLTEAEREEAKQVIFGTTAKRMFTALSKTSKGELEKLTESVNKEGQALKASATRMDTLQGKFEIFTSVLQGTAINIGSKFLPALKGIFDTATPLAAILGEKLTQGVELLGQSFGMLAEKIGLSPKAFEDFGKRAKAAFEKIDVGNVLEGLSFGALDISKSIDLRKAKEGLEAVEFNIKLSDEGQRLFDNLSTLGSKLAESLGGVSFPSLDNLSGQVLPAINTGLEFVITNFDVFSGLLQGFTVGVGFIALAGTATTVGAGLLSMLTPLNLIIAAAGALGVAWQTNFLGIQDVTYQTIDTIQQMYEAFQAGGVEGVAESLGFGEGAVAQITRVGEILQATWENLKTGFAGFAEAMMPSVEAIGQLGKTVVDELMPALGFVALGAGAAGVLLLNGFGMVLPKIGELINQYVVGATTVVTGMIDFFAGAIDMLGNLFTGNIEKAREGAQQVLQGVAGVFEGAFTLIGPHINGIYDGVVFVFEKLYDVLVGHSIVPDMIDAIVEAFNNLVDPVLSASELIRDDVVSIFGSMSEAVTDTLEAISNFELPDLGLSEAASSAGSFLSGLNPFGGGGEDDASGGAMAGMNLQLMIPPEMLESVRTLNSDVAETLIPTLSQLDELLLKLSSETFPPLSQASLQLNTDWLTVHGTVANSLNPILSQLFTLIDTQLTPAINGQLTPALSGLNDMIMRVIEAMKKQVSQSGKVVEKMKKEKVAVKELSDFYLALAEAIRDANRARGETPSGGGAPPGFAGGGQFIVPEGYSGYGMPIRVHSGELVTVLTRAQTQQWRSGQRHSIDRSRHIVSSSATHTTNNSSSAVNNFNLTVQSQQPSRSVERSFALMRARAGV